MKKIFALLLMISLMILQGTMNAEEKGTELVLQKRNGQKVRGELIAVKESSLLLVEQESGADLSVEIKQIKTIVIVKKPRLNYAFFGGLLVGGALGGYLGATMYGSGEEALAIMLGALGAVAFATLGGLISGASSSESTLHLLGKTDQEIQDILEKLRNIARVKHVQ